MEEGDILTDTYIQLLGKGGSAPLPGSFLEGWEWGWEWVRQYGKSDCE